jgi:S-adenosylmethionine synthetase
VKHEFLFTSESATEGHPDKLCDQIADAIVDRLLQHDPLARVEAESAVSTGILFIAARFAGSTNLDVPELARQVIARVGYEGEDFNPRTCTIMTSLGELPDGPRRATDESELTQDQIERMPARQMANVFGFAARQTDVLLPLPIWLAHRLARRLAAARLEKPLRYLAPDGKTQVGVEFRDRRPHRIHSITLIASQREAARPTLAKLREDLLEQVIGPAFDDEALRPDMNTRIYINPDGPQVTGGPTLHSGLTGRKNAMDTYGEYARHSESALSGKDPSRIDRIGAYAARHAAKNVVAAGLADECEVQLSYSVGQARPVSVQIDTRGTGTLSDDEIAERVVRTFDFRPAAIVRAFRLRALPSEVSGGFYQRLAAYGHMGRVDLEVPWERTDRARALRD